MTLSLYVARRFLRVFAIVFFVFFALMTLIDMVEQIRRFGTSGISFSGAATLALLNAPQSLYRILPLIVILTTIGLFLALARSSELVVTRAAGRAGLVTLAAPLVTAVVLGGLAVAVLNPLVAATSKRAEALSQTYRAGPQSDLSISREGLWLRQAGGDGQTVIRAERSNLDATELYGVTFLTVAESQGPVRRIDAETARLTPGAWVLTNAREWRFAAGTNPEAGVVAHPELSVPSDLTAAQIRDSFGTPSAIPIWELPAFIAALQRAGYSATKHSLWLQMELALPLLLGAMVLIGAGFTMRHARSGGTGVMVLLAILFGFAVFFLRNFAQVLGENGQIPVVVAALSSLALLLHLEDG